MTKINAQLLACLLGPALLSARPATMTTLNKNKVEHLWRPSLCNTNSKNPPRVAVTRLLKVAPSNVGNDFVVFRFQHFDRHNVEGREVATRVF